MSIATALAPALLAGAAGAAAQFGWQDPTSTIIAAAAGALAGGAMLPGHGPSLGRHARAAAAAAAAASGRAAPARAGTGEMAMPAPSGKLLLERLPLAVLMIDERDVVRFANPMASELFGRLPEAGFHVAALRAPKLLAGIGAARAGAGAVSVDFAVMRKCEIHLRAHLRLLDDVPKDAQADTAGSVIAVIEDITQNRRTETLYRDFVANASHELKTPLASISGIIETLQGHARDDPEAAERFLGIMATQAERMRRLINDMLSLSRIEQNERVPPRNPQPLREIVGETVEAMQPIADAAGVALAAALPDAETVVLGSREELSQVFQNLIDNAIKYARPEDRVWVEPVATPEERRGMIGVVIGDTGPGIPRTDLPRLTERFYRVSVPKSRARGGTGLGLAIVKHVLSRHRGDLEIESELGQGSRFTVWLPVVAVSAEVSAAEPAEAVTPPAGR
ncbi:phosphate regulon sensor histidine kinase PhoR [Paralimibaculum aggregatum]|uniref:histidine kinase n=1 Tax=Paralimibaculum aggregatum TaxID=3036245 RepID=A0ABQ6LRY5_9RHOB|nr:ATP-binding protein [Limibaculum sp. NKW23]GMG84205.1 phosphate regulon sensor histidine kinase PhoR [Limibaculum sp. NKW23]